VTLLAPTEEPRDHGTLGTLMRGLVAGKSSEEHIRREELPGRSRDEVMTKRSDG